MAKHLARSKERSWVMAHGEDVGKDVGLAVGKDDVKDISGVAE